MKIEKNDLSAGSIRARREQYAVAVCAELYLKHGIEAVKMTDIADACGIGVATLYRYFGSKPGITIKAATFLWKDVRLLFSKVLDSEEYAQMNGADQIATLMRMFLTLYKEQRGFLKFLGELDVLLQEDFPKEDLSDYENSLVDFYPICESAYQKGLSDHSIRQLEDFQTYYRCYTHGLMALCQKFIRGEVLPGDDFSKAEEELEMMIESALFYLQP